ncbi:MAG: thioesterase family protein [Planctomycetota bacterium]
MPQPHADPDATPPPTEFTHRLRVRYAECDPFKVAHHSSYVAWLEEARTEMLRPCGVSYAELETRGVYLVITKLELKYRRPIRYDDVLDIFVSASAAGTVRLRHQYELRLIERFGRDPDRADPAVPADGVCAIATTELACVNADGRPQPMPAWLVGA